MRVLDLEIGLEQFYCCEGFLRDVLLGAIHHPLTSSEDEGLCCFISDKGVKKCSVWDQPVMCEEAYLGCLKARMLRMSRWVNLVLQE